MRGISSSSNPLSAPKSASTSTASLSSSWATYTARTCARTIAPVWDEEFRFDILDDALLQDEPLLIRVMDERQQQQHQLPPQQTYGGGSGPAGVPLRDESLGVVYIDLNPLLTTQANLDETNASAASQQQPQGGCAGGGGGGAAPTSSRALSPDQHPHPHLSGSLESGGGLGAAAAAHASGNAGGAALAAATATATGVTTIEGWLPLYDTLNGVRGEILVSIKLNLIGDVNPFRDSSAGVRLLPFSTLDPASGYAVKHIFGALL
jgi:C2 domain